MRKILIGALLGFVATTANAQWCPSLLAGAFAIQASTLDAEVYAVKRTAWIDLLKQRPATAAAIRERLVQDDTLINWLALHDGLSAEQDASLFEAAKSLEHESVALIEKRTLWSATADGALRFRRLPLWGLKQVRFYLPRRIPRVSDDWPKWLLQTLTELNSAIVEAQFLTLPQDFSAHIKHADGRAYEVAYQLESALDVSLPFPKQKIENHYLVTEASLYALRFVFPVSGRVHWFPQNERFRIYATARAEGTSARTARNELQNATLEGYGSRRRLAAFSRIYRSILLTTSMVGATWGSVEMVQAYRNGTWRAKLDAVLSVGNVVADPVERERAIREYSEDPNGYDSVVIYYTEQIDALEKQRRENGDADGAIAKEIDFKRQQMKELMR